MKALNNSQMVTGILPKTDSYFLFDNLIFYLIMWEMHCVNLTECTTFGHKKRRWSMQIKAASISGGGSLEAQIWKWSKAQVIIGVGQVHSNCLNVLSLSVRRKYVIQRNMPTGNRNFCSWQTIEFLFLLQSVPSPF